MKIITLILFSFSVATGCAKTHMANTNTDTTPAVTTQPAAADSITYLALGDSYTIGESVDALQSFPYQLRTSLWNEGLRNTAVPLIIARTGWRTDNLMYAIDEAKLGSRKFDFVTLLIGVNDQFQHKDTASYHTMFKRLLDTAIHYARNDVKRVFVISIPDYSVTPFAADMDRATIAQQIDEFNAINLNESKKAGVTYINITDISRRAATDSTLIAKDGLHPSVVMYELWVQRLLGPVAALLKQKE